ncbi:NAD(P)/FAD-dependent oxidoreductase [Albimonas pacifica]|uniref:Putative flavoprotein involved in K+ transport n=1 Tax=Albimonas pacifica TaxID=1114924 RepID=A0A1I3BIG0_9RHOB|nr:NAD(P)/FAD-dependent oxidoreductase [Albimonas pacifica]SFH62053.1 putative flavoprotein involved in K+ transport [Albimonas pacifica]
MSIETWARSLTEAVCARDPSAVEALFQPGGFWRDFVAAGGTLQTIEGAPAIAAFACSAGADAGLKVTAEAPPLLPGADPAQEGFVAFETALGHGRGYVRLQDGRCRTLMLTLEGFHDHPEPLRARRPSGLVEDAQGRNWKERLAAKGEQYGQGEDPYVLIVGGGQAGLALAARLEMLGVPYLVVDRHPRVGDQWRSRYKALTLHDPVWYDHMPYMPFPDFWPVFTPKDKMGDWLAAYSHAMELVVWTGTECLGAAREGDGWTVTLKRGDETVTLSPKHLVMAVGNAGFPKVPQFEGREAFGGVQLHSSEFASGEGMEGRRVVIVGANNSAHDIAADLAAHGAKPVMIQRSSTMIVQQTTVIGPMLGPLFSQEAVERGVTTERADLMLAASPFRVQEENARRLWAKVREDEAGFYDALEAAGFALDFGEDGTGMLKYPRTASGYYFDVGACAMVIDGRIGLRSGKGVARLRAEGVELDDGEVLPAEMIVYATGFGAMEEWVARLIDPETAARVGRCWGYGSGVRGDPGPWEGELRNMWKPTPEPGLWFMGGNLAQSRFYSRLLGLQLKARHAGLALGPA